MQDGFAIEGSAWLGNVQNHPIAQRQRNRVSRLPYKSVVSPTTAKTKKARTQTAWDDDGQHGHDSFQKLVEDMMGKSISEEDKLKLTQLPALSVHMADAERADGELPEPDAQLVPHLTTQEWQQRMQQLLKKQLLPAATGAAGAEQSGAAGHRTNQSKGVSAGEVVASPEGTSLLVARLFWQLHGVHYRHNVLRRAVDRMKRACKDKLAAELKVNCQEGYNAGKHGNMALGESDDVSKVDWKKVDEVGGGDQGPPWEQQGVVVGDDKVQLHRHKQAADEEDKWLKLANR